MADSLDQLVDIHWQSVGGDKCGGPRVRALPSHPHLNLPQPRPPAVRYERDLNPVIAAGRDVGAARVEHKRIPAYGEIEPARQDIAESGRQEVREQDLLDGSGGQLDGETTRRRRLALLGRHALRGRVMRDSTHK